MRKIFIFIILFSFFFGNLTYSQTFQMEGRDKRARGETSGKPSQENGLEMKGERGKSEEKNQKISPEEITPVFEFIFHEKKIKKQAQIKGKVKEANSVEFYCQLSGAVSPIYLGNAQFKSENLWELEWDTNLTPNGEYFLFAKITNQYGEYESPKIEIKIENEIPKRPEREEELKKEHEKIKEEVGQIEEEIKKIEEKTKEEITQEAEKKVEKEEIKKITKEFTEKIKEEKKIEKEVEKSTGEKEKQEEKVKDLEIKVRETKEVIQKIPTPSLGINIIKEEKETRLETEKKELQKFKEADQNLKKELEKRIQEKEEIKKGIIEKIKPEKKDEVFEKLETLEKEIKEKEEIKIEKEAGLIKDSDGDDLSNDFEISIGTDPFNPDSDGDGFLDGEEYKLGYNSLKPGAADKIVYSDAKKAKPQKTDIYKVEKVSVITLPTKEWKIKIEGKGLPNSFVTIYIYSSPIVMVTRADGNGNWSIVLDKPLTDGVHEVYTTVTNNHGEITAKSEPFVFEKSGERIVAITVAGILSPKTVSPIETYQKSFLILILALIVLAIGIAFIIISVFSQRKLKKEENKEKN